jgi:protein-tyrosine phosphatase
MKVLMVCLGNICRSPLAEGILRQKIKEKKISNVFVDSCGTSDYHIGQTPDKRTQDNAIKHGTDLSNLRGRQFAQSDFDSFDKIFVMDSSNKEDVLALARNNEDKNKVELLLNITHPNNNLGVPDPYFGGANGFEDVYILVDAACEKLSDSLR